MGRRPMVNDVPLAPFSLINREPMRSQEVYEKLNFRRYLAARGKTAENRATQDPNPCPACGAAVEWAFTFKRDPAHPKGGENFIYARCKDNPSGHRWGFRDQADAPSPRVTPPAAPVESHDEIEITEAPPTHKETPAMPETAPVVKPAPGSFDALIAAVVDGAVGARVTALEEKLQGVKLDPDAIAKMIDAAAQSMRKVEITIPALPKAHFTGKAHPMLERMLTLIAAYKEAKLPAFFMLVGPAASGKSTLAKQVASTLQKKLTAVSINETMTREEVLGWRSPNLQTGEVKYTPSAIVEGWERGDVILLDEVDRGNPNTLCALNSIEQRVLYVPRSDAEGGSEAAMGKGAVLICTANTYGTGASRTYVGANQLDAAFLDRFTMLEVGYSKDLEIEITQSPEAVNLMWEARRKADERSVRRPLTTRMIRRVVIDATVSKRDLKETFKAACKEAGWTETEINTVWN